MQTVSKADVEQKLAKVSGQIEQLEQQRSELLKRKEFLATAINEFFDEKVAGDSEDVAASLPTAAPTDAPHEERQGLKPEDVDEMTVADASEWVLENSWMTVRRLMEALNRAGKNCTYKAVRVALDRNKGKRFVSRATGPITEWRNKD